MKESDIVASTDVYEVNGGTGTQVDLVLPLAYKDPMVIRGIYESLCISLLVKATINIRIAKNSGL